MRKNFALVALLMGVVVMPGPAVAGQSDLSAPVSLIVTQHNLAFFNTNGTRTNAPACATAYNRWAFNLGTDHGKAIFAAVMSAQARGKRVWVNGTGTCSLWGDTESIDHILIED